jgi:hypothetical protein
MAEFEIPFKLENSDYNELLLLEKYGDNYGIVLAQESKNGDGTNYKRWCYPQRRVEENGKMVNKPAEKGVPWKVPLGPKAQAVAILKAMVKALEPISKAEPTDDDTPF